MHLMAALDRARHIRRFAPVLIMVDMPHVYIRPVLDLALARGILLIAAVGEVERSRELLIAQIARREMPLLELCVNQPRKSRLERRREWQASLDLAARRHDIRAKRIIRRSGNRHW